MKILVFLLVAIPALVIGQASNITVVNPTVDLVLKGQYSPSIYLPTQTYSPDQIFQGIQNEVNADSLKAYIVQLASFKNRNSGADTLSLTEGMGAARNWAFSKFQEFSTANENRLLPSFLTFDQNICGVTKHKNVLAVLPGLDTANHQIIIIEGHMDSRCAGLCDTACIAEGVEDNASGTALVLELARVMSQYSYNNTIVFMLTTAEEQGLYGAHAFADYCSNNDLPVRAVLNNDVIGGVVCGETSSPPSCPGLNDVDSTQVRLFSIGSFNSAHKQLARFIKLEYQEELLPLVSVPMTLTIMSAEDRSGRGGDHIPFRQKFYPAMRFTSANEHGDASNGPGYSDRQHTSDDILGVDTNNDQIVDSFFVDFNYLARNACINGIAATVAAQGVPTPSYTVTGIEDSIVRFNVNIDSLPGFSTYRVAIRTTSNDWDTVYTLNGTSIEVIPPVANTSYYVSVATVNADGLESLFSSEKMLNQVTLDVTELEEVKGIELMQNHPNPFDEATYINIRVGESMVNQLAIIRIYDTQGKVVETMQTRLELGMNEMLYTHGYGRVGVYLYSLEVNGQLIDTKRMIFAN